MKKLIVVSLLLAAAISAAQPDCQLKIKATNRVGDTAQFGQQLQTLKPLTTIGTPFIDNRLKGCTSWELGYDSEGFSNLGIFLRDAPIRFVLPFSFLPDVFVNFQGTISTGTNPLTNLSSGYLVASGYYPFIGVLIGNSDASNDIVGTGSINIVLNGWKSPNMFSKLRLKNGKKEVTK